MYGQAVRSARDDRRRAILEVARDIFLQEGYAAASMSAIAARVGGSKGTLYNYFPSKELLFAALMDAECETEAWLNSTVHSESDTVAGALTDIGHRFLGFALGDKAQNIHRLVVAECGRFPELGQTFFENGPKRSIALVAGWIEAQVRAGRLQVDEPERAATQFLDLCKSGLHQKMMWNVGMVPSDEAKAANVRAAVAVFMAAYGAPAALSAT